MPLAEGAEATTMTATHSHTRRTLFTVAKLALAAAILAYLIAQAHDGVSRVSEQTLAWPLLAAGMLCTFAASTCSFMRWHLLIHAVGIDARLVDSRRLGALGLALNFVSPGSIGGDFFKAIFLAHGQPGRRTEAVATVVADRVLGLLTMLLLASLGILTTNLSATASIPVRVLCQGILLSTVISWTGAALLLFVPALSGLRVSRWAEMVPLVGATAARLLGAVRAYRTQ